MDVLKIAKALSDPLRLEILKRIAGKKCCEDKWLCVCHLVDDTGLLQSRVSYHIRELKEANLIREETRGRWNYYYFKEETLKEYLSVLNDQFQLHLQLKVCVNNPVPLSQIKGGEKIGS